MKDQAMIEVKLTTHEIQVLRECAGELLPSPWGAWVGACLEFLYESGYTNRVGELTAKGHEALAALKAA